MRILQVVNSLAAGGAEIFVASLAAQQRRSGHEVEVFTYAGAVDARGQQLEEMLRESDVAHVSPVARSTISKVGVPLQIAAEVRRFLPDVVHSHLEQSDVFVAASRLLTIKARPAFVRTVHNVTPDYLPLWAHKLVAHGFDCGVACGQAPFESYTAFGRMKRLIENGIDLRSLNVTRNRRDVRAGLGLSGDDVVLVNVGSFGYRYGELQKGQDLIIQALAMAARPDLRVVFLGDGQLRPQMEGLARSRGVDGQCRFVGTVSDPGNYLAMANAAVMPSRFEGLSIAAIEAACIGLPLILSEIPAFAPFTSMATVGATAESYHSLAEAMVEFAVHRERYTAAAEALAATYRSRFGIEAVAQHYLHLYEEVREVLASSRAGA